ncbi:MAG TPA: NUDIX hydrolase [Planctomycetaceae bacterium]|nr:NUDIX hydrolase [Planctomycetaceae bacterium]
MDTLFAGKLFKVVRKYVTGRSGEQLERHVILHPGAVAIIPVLDDGSIVLLKQYRVAADRYLIELPAGTIDDGEEPRETARRELVEETGYAPTSLTELTAFFSSPGILREKMHLFLATDLVAGPTDLEDGEEIERFTVPLEQTIEMIYNGKITDGKTILGLLWYWNSKRLECEHPGP